MPKIPDKETVETFLAIDTETTGINFRHGCKPFVVTTCDQDGEVNVWEWDVDPLTRIPQIPFQELKDIRKLIFDAHKDSRLVFHNSKFDVTALGTIGIWEDYDLAKVWERTEDTLLAGHLLASNRPKDLTSMGIQYLGIDISKHEDLLTAAIQESRKGAKKEFPNWRLAKEGDPMIPSASEKAWRNDYWVPRAVAKALKYPPNHPWWTALSKYAHVDAEVTMALLLVVREKMRERNLLKLYECRRKVPAIIHKMEEIGITLSGTRLRELEKTFGKEAGKAGSKCMEIAEKMNFPELELPNGGINDSLRTFCFDHLKLEPVRSKKAKTDKPSLDKASMEKYFLDLSYECDARTFLENLRDRKGRMTALSYMQSYRNFWLPVEGKPGWWRLFPSLNATGTATLRFSSSDPNEQQISKQEGLNLRYCFGPAPGREWWSMDAKNIELRLPAYESKEKKLIELFEQPDAPPFYGSNHLLVFSWVYPELWETAAKEVGLEKAGPYCKKKYAAKEYQWCKNGNFAVQYGAIERFDGWGTADKAYHRQYAHRRVKAGFSALEGLNQHWLNFANKYGFVETIPDLTIDPERGYPLLCTRTDNGGILPTVPLNYHVQGSAMWWTMKAMIRCQAQLDEWNRNLLPQDRYNLVMQVHDEMVFDFPKRGHPSKEPRKSNLARIKILQKLMELGGDDFGGIPTPVGIEYHEESWNTGIVLA